MLHNSDRAEFSLRPVRLHSHAIKNCYHTTLRTAVLKPMEPHGKWHKMSGIIPSYERQTSVEPSRCKDNQIPKWACPEVIQLENYKPWQRGISI